MTAQLQTAKTLMVMAGGTGGHVYPAIAVADYLMTQGWQVVWLCTEGGMENRLIANKPYQTALITMQGVRGKGLSRWLKLPINLFKACKQAYIIIQKAQPNLVLGMGGFAAFPGGVMAKILGKPLVIHEQNAVAGLTNKVLSRIATRTLAAFPEAFKRNVSVVGNPVRHEITAIPAPEQRFADRQGSLRIFVVGGSLGAQAINTAMPKALAMMPIDKRPVVVHQAGEKHITQLKQAYTEAQVSADTQAYINDMAAMYAWADIVICRAGALTIAELAAAGVASILVPFPHAVDDHQTKNAHYLSLNHAAILFAQDAFKPEVITELLTKLTREECLNKANIARRLGKPMATAEVVAICMELAR